MQQTDFKNHITQNLAFLKESKLLIAISGGLDSVVLTHLCYQLELDITLAHCNFNLRGAESDGDEAFVVQLATQLDLEVFIEHFDTKTYAEENTCSIQMAARDLRYNWFKELANQLGFDYILTAHHADDNLETFLINLTRGTGVEGLTGIPEVNTNVVRPLLVFSRTAIQKYAEAHEITWRDDSSNASVKYLRNKLRHDVIPILKTLNTSLLQSFDNTLNHLKDTTELVDDRIAEFLKEAIASEDDTKITFKISEFKKQNNPKAYLFQVFSDYGFTEWDVILNLLDAQSGKQVFSNTHRLIKNRDHLLLTEIASEAHNDIAISINQNDIEFPLGVLKFSEVETVSKQTSNTVFIDESRLKYPLILRKPKEGDVFYPFGMTGKKKLSKYLKDEKISILDKEHIWVLCSADAIVWVINKRADNRFRVTENTKSIIKITLEYDT